MRINNNIMALNAHRQLGTNQANASKSMEKLSSGFRINRAGDDAAGLAISEKMRGQIRGLKQASRNAQDGISLIQTAEGALNETHAILQRMRELANQAASDTNVIVDRDEIQKEMNQLTSELNRIGNTTEFNTMKLLNGGEVTATGSAAGVIGNFTVDTNSQEMVLASGGIGTNLTISALAGGSYEGTAGNIEIEISASSGATPGAIFADGKLTITLNSDNDMDAAAINAALAGSFASDFEVAGAGTVSDSDTVTLSNGADGQAGVYSFEITTNFADGDVVTIAGIDYIAGTDFIVGDDIDTTATALANAVGGDYSATSTGGVVTLTETTASGTDLVVGDISIRGGGGGGTGTGYTAVLQIGANTGQSFTVQIDDMRAAALGISTADKTQAKSVVVDGKTYNVAWTASADVTNGTDSAPAEYALDVSSHDNATAAIQVIDDAITTVSAERSKLGAMQNRLEHTITNLGTSAENLQAAESRIRDLDMAEEIMAFTKNNILQQAATAMLAQANMAPQSVLQLLG